MSEFDELNNDELMDDDALNIISLTDENGDDQDFEFLDLVTYEGKEYAILLPLDEDDNGMVLILEVNAIDDETEEYLAVEDEAIINAIFDIFKENFKDDFNFED